ncbi:MAG: hypothetical protein NZ924_06210 [Candidatus Bipolaricaulota bacterium]|nr:hypothetical protein [Candidatus Bipolaricaulota bacterium]MDW8152478.1 hypothetical protein [Candidatus Bipolaricaulota bacterium]
MRRFAFVFWAFFWVLAFAQPEEFRDLNFGNKPFNPGDVGLLQRALVRDNDAANTDPIYFTRVAVENLGTAKPEDLEWVELRMENSCGRTVVLARGPGFPLQEVLLGRDPEERQIADDGEAYFYVWVKVTERITEGRTLQPRIILSWAEGEKGGTLELRDGTPEKLVLSGSFGAKALPGPEGGNLNPGDRLPVAEVEVEDTADVNPWGLDLVRIRIDGPSGLVWILDNGVTQLEVPVGRDYALPEPLFAALDEGNGKLTLWVEVPEGFRPKDPVTVAPTLTLALKEAGHTQTFRVADPVADRVVAAGLEILELGVPQAGKVLSPAPGTLLYSTLKIGDQDRNATPIRLDSLALNPLGTLTAVAGVEVVDQGGRLLGFAKGIEKPVALVSPDGKPLLLPDEATWTLSVALALPGKIPLGASLLLAHELAVEEVLPPDWLARPGATTRFKGIQGATPKEAVFFGRPTVRLAKVGDQAVLATDGETIGLLSGRLAVRPWELVDFTSGALAGYRLSTKALADGISFVLEAGRAQAKAGDLAAFAVALKPVRMPAKEVTVTLDLSVERVVDWAGIALPFAVGPSQVAFTYAVPQIGLQLDPQTPSAVLIQADAPLSALKVYVHFDPALPVELKEVVGVEPYAAEVEAEEKPVPGRVALALALLPEKKPAGGPLAKLVFAKKTKEAVAVPVRLEVREVLGAEGKRLPFFLAPEAVELKL